MAESLRGRTLQDDWGRIMDGTFDLEVDGTSLAVTLHARGGSQPGATTNRDYFEVLEQILERLSTAGAELRDVVVDSRPARQLPIAQRRIGLEYPLSLNAAVDAHALRVRITEAQPDIASSRPAGSKGGNKHKRLRLTFDIDGEIGPALALLGVLPVSEVQQGPSPVFGSKYHDDPIDQNLKPSSVFSRDDSKLERSLAGHASTQHLLAQRLRSAGLEPVKRGPGEPDFDIAWLEGDRVAVAEVKSLSKANVTRQLRTGIGQVLEYRYQLRKRTGRSVRAVLAVEHDPGADWAAICVEAQIVLTWPPNWPALLGGA